MKRRKLIISAILLVAIALTATALFPIANAISFGTTIAGTEGTANNGALVGSTWDTGFEGYGTKYVTGSSQYTNFGAISGLNALAGFTVAIWIRPDSMPTWSTFGCDWIGSDGHLFFGSDGTYVRFAFSGGGYRTSSQAIANLQWQRVVAVYVGGGSPDAHIYINGTLRDGALSGQFRLTQERSLSHLELVEWVRVTTITGRLTILRCMLVHGQARK